MQKEALDKLAAEYAAGKYDKYGEIMKKRVLEALQDFCRRSEEFARAVVDGGTFADCMKAVANNVGSGISDLDAFTRAVQFYFPTAAVRFSMQIDLAPHAGDADTAHSGAAVLDLDLADFL